MQIEKYITLEHTGLEIAPLNAPCVDGCNTEDDPVKPSKVFVIEISQLFEVKMPRILLVYLFIVSMPSLLRENPVVVYPKLDLLKAFSSW